MWKTGKVESMTSTTFSSYGAACPQYDNWRSARSIQIQHLGFTTLDCSRYGPDFGLSEFHLLPEVKEQPTGHHYMSDDEARTAVTLWFCHQMHKSITTDSHKTTWTLVKECRLKRWLCGEITVQRWKPRFKKVTCFDFTQICLHISIQKLQGITYQLTLIPLWIEEYIL
jgi:hypothetical protein